MSLLIKNALIEDSLQDIYLEEGIIKCIGENLAQENTEVLDAAGKIAIPSFFNGHTHAAMTLLRGYADDMFLQEWLQQKIWPIESRLRGEDIYWGAKLACLEMIKSGTTFFNDMYWHRASTVRAVEEMGIRAVISGVFNDGFDSEKSAEQKALNTMLYEQSQSDSQRILFALGPHSIYTVSRESLQWCGEFSQEHNIPLHIHLSETEQEVNDCLKIHRLSPVEYLEKIGFLSPHVIAVHCVWLDEREIEILKKYQVKIVYNPVSNMKLAVGKAMPYQLLKDAGLTIALGTDGCSSNNNLDMMESMKFASLLQKFYAHDSCVLPAREAFSMATGEGARAFGLKGGMLKPGYLADLLLIDGDRAELTPGFNIISDLVYSANGGCVNTVICNGQIVMKDRCVPGEAEIISKANECVKRLI